MMRVAVTITGLFLGAAIIAIGNAAFAAPMANKAPIQRSKGTSTAAHLPKADPNSLSVVHAQLTIHKKVLHYTVTTGYMPMKGNGKVQAKIFFIAYTKDPKSGISATTQRNKRPVTFLFNGGPGGYESGFRTIMDGGLCGRHDQFVP